MTKRSSDENPIDRIAEEAIQRIRDAAKKEKSMHAVEQQLDKSRRGPQPGTGGRPRKGTEKREKRGISLDPVVARWIEEERQAPETFSEALERLLRRQMPNREN